MISRAISLGPATRFAGLSSGAARAILAILALLVAWGLTHPPLMPSGQPGAGDAALYRAVAERVGRGEPYHAAAAAEQRLRGYPLRPFTAMRPPLLAEIGAAIGPTGADLLLRLLGVATSAAIGMRLFQSLASPTREVAVVLAASSVGMIAPAGMWVWHELWAGLLVALALACRTERRWGAAVFLGLAATLIRELALPFLPLMAVMAVRTGRRGEAVGWAAAFLCAVLAIAGHALLAVQASGPGDAASPGWLAFGGWSFLLTLARHGALLLALPACVTAVALPLALLGWAAWRDPFAERAGATIAVWLCAFLIVGRPDNDYWGFLLAPLLPIGLACALPALRDLGTAAMDRQPVLAAHPG